MAGASHSANPAAGIPAGSPRITEFDFERAPSAQSVVEALTYQPVLMRLILNVLVSGAGSYNPTADALARSSAGLAVKWLALGEDTSFAAGMVLGSGVAGVIFLTLGAFGLFELNAPSLRTEEEVMAGTSSLPALTLGAASWLSGGDVREGVRLGQIVDFGLSANLELAEVDQLEPLPLISLLLDTSETLQAAHELNGQPHQAWMSALPRAVQPPPPPRLPAPTRSAPPPQDQGPPNPTPAPPTYPVPHAPTNAPGAPAPASAPSYHPSPSIYPDTPNWGPSRPSYAPTEHFPGVPAWPPGSVTPMYPPWWD